MLIDGIASSPNIGSQVFIDGVTEYNKKYVYITKLANDICHYNFLLETSNVPTEREYFLNLKANVGFQPKKHATGSAHVWSSEKLNAFTCYSDYRYEGFLFKDDNPVILSKACPIGSWLRVEGHLEYKNDPAWL